MLAVTVTVSENAIVVVFADKLAIAAVTLKLASPKEAAKALFGAGTLRCLARKNRSPQPRP